MTPQTEEYKHPVSEQPLKLTHTREKPDFSDVTVYEEGTERIGGHEFTVYVIGASHCVYSQTAEFTEVASCKPLTDEAGDELELRPGITKSIEYSDENIDATIDIQNKTLDEFDRTDNYSLIHKFGENAYTAVKFTQDGWETFHTYPDHDLTIHTVSVIAVN